MAIRIRTMLGIFTCGLLLFATLSDASGVENIEIAVSNTPGKQEVRYSSGKTVYVEALVEGRWVGRYWFADAGATKKQWPYASAFEIRIKSSPTPPTTPGELLSTGWQWESASELPSERTGTRHFAVTLSNSAYPITVKIHTLLDGTAILTRWLEITNTSNKSVALTGLMPWAGRLWSGRTSISLGHSIRWQTQWEGWFGWTPLRAGINVFKNDRGLAYDDPFFVLRNEAKQEYFFGHLAWPANYRMEFHVSDGVTFKIGPKLRYALRVIRPAETILTPAVHLGRVQGDFDATVQEMHEHIRRSVLPPRGRDRSYLIQYLSNEDNPLTVYRGREYNEDTVKKCIDVAAAAGLEVCIVDGPTWCKAYGDWLVPDPQRFPRGFGPIVEYAHQKGLLFGLYAEPEGGREGYCGPGGGACIGNWDQSEVFIKHPNWFNQPGSILNLSIPEAAAYMDSELGQIIDHFHLDLYRHDFNAPLRNQGPYTLRDGYLENDYWRHYDALYDIFGRAHAGHPNVIWQQASGGGTRLELSTAGVFDENYTSDRVTFPYVYRMTSGLSVYLPPEILVTPNGMAGPNQPDLETILRSTYALGNTPMLFNGILPKSLNDFTQTQRQMFLRYANLYKKSIRPILPSCRVYHHAPVNAVGGVESGGWFAMEFTSPDRKRGWGIVIRLSNQVFGNYLFKPRGIDPAKNYDVWFDNERRRETFEGSRLVQEGLRIRLEARPASELILFEEK